MRVLVGDTGFVGQNLLSFMQFDKTYNSKNIQELAGLGDSIDIYLACLPATKWLIEKDPLADLENVQNIVNVLNKNTYNNIYLFSTIDVYTNALLLSNESTLLTFDSPGYGANRYIFELFITNNLSYNSLKIIRLPSLFGPGLKKNILFDVKNNNQIEKINRNSLHQWYNMERLEKDLEKINSIDAVKFNFFPEPIETKEILEGHVGHDGERFEYNFQTIHTPSGYWYDKDTAVKEVKEFLCK
jgi:hypothetical protein